MVLFPWKHPDKFVRDAEEFAEAVGVAEPLPFPEYVLEHLVEVEEWRGHLGVLLDMVRGTVHPDYAGKSWFWLLRHGKRMPHNLEMLVLNPEYYFTPGKKLPTMSYLSFGGDFYVYGDGNHRTCLAKFLRAMLPERSPELWEKWRGVIDGVEVYVKRVNREVLRAFVLLGGLDGLVTVSRERIGRWDEEGYRRDVYRLSFGVLRGGKMLRGITGDDLVELASAPGNIFERIKGFISEFPGLLKLKIR